MLVAAARALVVPVAKVVVAAAGALALGAVALASLTLFSGTDRPEFRQRIIGMIADSKSEIGWDLESDYRFFCAEEFIPTHFEKTSSGGIQGPRFWDISEQAELANNDSEIAARLRNVTWE